MSAVSIETASETDLDGMLRLLQLLFAIEKDFYFDEARQRQGLLMLLEQSDALLLVAKSADRVIGMCSAQLNISTAAGGYSLLVEDLVVSREQRGRGVAGRLLESVGKWAAARDVLRFQLVADRENGAALAFYKRRGWQLSNLLVLYNHPDTQTTGEV